MVVNNGNDFSAGQRRSCYFMMSYHPHVATPHLRAHERDIPFKFLPQDQWTRSKYTYPSFPGRTCNAFLAYFSWPRSPALIPKPASYYWITTTRDAQVCPPMFLVERLQLPWCSGTIELETTMKIIVPYVSHGMTSINPSIRYLCPCKILKSSFHNSSPNKFSVSFDLGTLPCMFFNVVFQHGFHTHSIIALPSPSFVVPIPTSNHITSWEVSTLIPLWNVDEIIDSIPRASSDDNLIWLYCN